ncbi:MAG: hypothetical protein U9R12_03505, partial [Candidatus Caldatribacteriota bacterium]|nr:hypothetical protein [Candidatus Caldatribacteriota bacterium]
RSNHSVDNLEWVDNSGNQLHRWKTQKEGLKKMKYEKEYGLAKVAGSSGISAYSADSDYGKMLSRNVKAMGEEKKKKYFSDLEDLRDYAAPDMSSHAHYLVDGKYYNDLTNGRYNDDKTAKKAASLIAGVVNPAYDSDPVKLNSNKAQRFFGARLQLLDKLEKEKVIPPDNMYDEYKINKQDLKDIHREKSQIQSLLERKKPVFVEVY